MYARDPDEPGTDDPEDWLAWAHGHVASGDVAAAHGAFRQAAKLDDGPSAALAYAEWLGEIGEDVLARRYCRRALYLSHDDAASLSGWLRSTVLSSTVGALHGLRSLARTVGISRSVVQIVAERLAGSGTLHPQGLIRLAWIFARERCYPEALWPLEQLGMDPPWEGEAQNAKGCVLALFRPKGRHAELELRAGLKVARTEPLRSKLTYNLAIALYLQRRFRDALDTLATCPEDPDVAWLRVRIRQAVERGDDDGGGGGGGVPACLPPVPRGPMSGHVPPVRGQPERPAGEDHERSPASGFGVDRPR